MQLDATIDDGTLTLTETLAGDMEGSAAIASGDLQLTKKYAFKGRVDMSKVDLSAAQNKLAPAIGLPVTVAGNVTATAALNGELEPFSWQASGSVSATGLRIRTWQSTGRNSTGKSIMIAWTSPKSSRGFLAAT